MPRMMALEKAAELAELAGAERKPRVGGMAAGEQISKPGDRQRRDMGRHVPAVGDERDRAEQRAADDLGHHHDRRQRDHAPGAPLMRAVMLRRERCDYASTDRRIANASCTFGYCEDRIRMHAIGLRASFCRYRPSAIPAMSALVRTVAGIMMRAVEIEFAGQVHIELALADQMPSQPRAVEAALDRRADRIDRVRDRRERGAQDPWSARRSGISTIRAAARRRPRSRSG